jgi:hypothetical protein
MAIPIIGSFDLSKDAPLDQRTQVADANARLALKWVHQGLLVYQVSNGKYYRCDVASRTQGSSPWTIEANWTEDPFDIVGTDGADGSVWWNGGADPNGATGVIGDYFIQTADGVTYFKGDIFYKTGASTWTFIMNNMGTDGLDAADGKYGSMYVDNNSAGTPQVISTSLVKLTQFDTNGLSNGVTTDHTTDRLTVVNTGIYILSYNIALSGSIADFTVIPHVNGSPIAGASSNVTLVSTADIQMLEVTTPISLTAADYVELYAKASAASKNFLMREATISLSTIGSTGATGPAGEGLKVTSGDVDFADDVTPDSRDIIETTSGATASNRYVITVLNDVRTDAERTALVTGHPLKSIVTDKMIAWDGTSWYIYGTWRGPKGNQGYTPLKGVDYDDGAPGTPAYSDFAQWITAPARAIEIWSVGDPIVVYLEQMQTEDFNAPSYSTYLFNTTFKYRSSADLFFSLHLIRLSGQGGSEISSTTFSSKTPQYNPASGIPGVSDKGLGQMMFTSSMVTGGWYRIRVSLNHIAAAGEVVELDPSYGFGTKIIK